MNLTLASEFGRNSDPNNSYLSLSVEEAYEAIDVRYCTVLSSDRPRMS